MFDFWALPYLVGKGPEIEQAVEFHALAERAMRWNDRPGHPESVTASTDPARLFETVKMPPAKYSATTTP